MDGSDTTLTLPRQDPDIVCVRARLTQVGKVNGAYEITPDKGRNIEFFSRLLWRRCDRKIAGDDHGTGHSPADGGPPVSRPATACAVGAARDGGGRGVTRTRSGQREEQWTERCGGGTAEPAETFAVAPAVRVVRSPAFSGGIGRSIVLLVDYRHAGNPCGRMLWH